MRTRFLGSFNPYPASAHTNFIWNQPDYVANVGGPEIGAKRMTQDVVTPRFDKLKNDGIIINNPFLSLYEQAGYTPGKRLLVLQHTPYADGSYWKVEGLINPGVGSYATEIDIDVDHYVTLACTDALSKVDAPAVQGLAILGELKDTIATLLDPIDGMRQFLQHTGNGKGLINGKSAKDLANQHLTVLYGVRPFMHDVEQILETLTGLKKSKRQTARGFQTVSRSRDKTRPYADPMGEMRGEIQAFANRTVSVRAYCMYEYKLDPGFNARFGMRLQDIPAALWELTPLSFVVDWALNISKLIGALTPSMNVTYLAQGYTIRDVGSVVEQLGDLTSNLAGYTGSGGGDIGTYSYIRTERVPVDLVQKVGLTYNPRINVTNILASLSLIIQRLKTAKPL
jgi:hypothetical protein